MNQYSIEGGHTISGEVTVQGAKNSVLPILAASLLAQQESIITNCPNIRDVLGTIKILEHLGCRTKRMQQHVLAIDPSSAAGTEIPDHLMREMRSSIILLGAILARNGHARISFPGGCDGKWGPYGYWITAKGGFFLVMGDGGKQ